MMRFFLQGIFIRGAFSKVSK